MIRLFEKPNAGKTVSEEPNVGVCSVGVDAAPPAPEIDPDSIKFTPSLSYAEQLLLQKNRRKELLSLEQLQDCKQQKERLVAEQENLSNARDGKPFHYYDSQSTQYCFINSLFLFRE